MIIRKLRLQNGWSQEQLAEMCGLSVRTIQRAERGQTSSTETLKAIAAVFEVNFTSLAEEKDMTEATNTTNTTNTTETTETTNMTAPESENQESEKTYDSRYVSEQEKAILQQVKDIKGFYTHLIQFVCVVLGLTVFNFFTSPEYYWVVWVIFGWGIGVIAHALNVFEVFNVFGADWEKKQIEKRLGRKL